MELILNVKPGLEHELVIDPDITEKTQFMHPAYQDAQSGLEGIIKSARRWYDDSKARRGTQSLYGYANNILMFSAARGQGKTSSMMSFAKYLGDTDRTEKNEKLRGCSFEIMDAVDPDMLQDGRSIVAMVLSYLYRKAEEAFRQGEYDDFRVTKWLTDFRRCFDWFVGKNEAGGTKSADVAAYREKNDGLLAKQYIYELIDGMFWMTDKRRSGTECPFLVLQLDDTDLGMRNAYALLEEVRQFLSLPNVLVLMAADVAQLRKLVAEHYCDALKTAIDRKIMSADDASHMAAKYVDKLIPASQMVQLPTMGGEYAMQKKVYVADGSGAAPAEKNELQRHLFRLIYEKTGLVFIPHDGYLNNIVPRTLRGIRQLYRMLNNMDNRRYALPESGKIDWQQWKADLETQRRNLIRFENYFLGDWCSSKLKTEHMKSVQTLSEALPAAKVRCAYRLLTDYGKEHGWDATSESTAPETSESTASKASKSKASKTSKSKASKTSESTASKTSESTDPKFLELLERNKKIRETVETEEAMVYTFAVMEYLSVSFHKRALLETIEAIEKVIKDIDAHPKADPTISLNRDKLKALIMAGEMPKEGVERVFWRCAEDFGYTGSETGADLRARLLADACSTVLLCNWEIWNLFREHISKSDNDDEWYLEETQKELNAKISSVMNKETGIKGYLKGKRKKAPGSDGAGDQAKTEAVNAGIWAETEQLTMAEP